MWLQTWCLNPPSAEMPFAAMLAQERSRASRCTTSPSQGEEEEWQRTGKWYCHALVIYRNFICGTIPILKTIVSIQDVRPRPSTSPKCYPNSKAGLTNKVSRGCGQLISARSATGGCSGRSASIRIMSLV